MPAFKEHAPEEIAQARTLYEDTATSVKDVARILGISENSLYRRVIRWGWRRRRLRVAEIDALAIRAARMRDEGISAAGRRVLDDRRSAVERAEAAVRGQLEALETMQARVAFAAHSVIEGERSARAIHALTKALREIEAIKREAASQASKAEYEFGVDSDELYQDLTRRIDELKQRTEPEEEARREQALVEEFERFEKTMPRRIAEPRIL